MHMDCNTHFSSLRPFLAENDASVWQTGIQTAQQCAQLTTVIHIFTLFLPSFSPTRLSAERLSVCDPPRSWRADCNLLSPCG